MAIQADIVLRNGPIWLRAASRSVTVDGKPITLTATEFDLLVLLLREAGRVVSKERISQSVLGRPLGPYDRSIDVHVSNLRRKLGDAPDGASPITTIHQGSDAGRLKASRTPVTTADRSLTVQGPLSRNF